MYMASDVLTLLNIVFKITDKFCEEFGFDFRFYFSTPYLVMNLILKISVEEIDLIIDVDRHFSKERKTWGYILNVDRILETNTTGQSTGEKSNMVFRDINSLYSSAMSHCCLPCENYKRLNDPCDITFPDISTVKENGP